jgi:hypothetical protein
METLADKWMKIKMMYWLLPVSFSPGPGPTSLLRSLSQFLSAAGLFCPHDPKLFFAFATTQAKTTPSGSVHQQPTALKRQVLLLLPHYIIIYLFKQKVENPQQP